MTQDVHNNAHMNVHEYATWMHTTCDTYKERRIKEREEFKNVIMEDVEEKEK